MKMNDKYKLLLTIYVLLSIVNIIVENAELTYWVYFTKPLLLTTLSLWFWLSTNKNSSLFSRLVLTGLIFSIGGDSFLMFVEPSGSNESGQQFFIFGLLCFLLAHLAYLAAFLKYTSTTNGFLKNKPAFLLLFLAFFIGNILFLWPALPVDLQVPVSVYSFVIISMAAGAANLKGKIPPVIFKVLFIGVVLFILSDSMIAVNKFHPHDFSVPYPRVLIMLSYLISQYLIATTCAKLVFYQRLNVG